MRNHRAGMFLLGLALVWIGPGARAGATVPAGFAVAGFDYVDTSGEPRDQRAEHADRVAAFTQALRDGLAASARFRIVALPCPPPTCAQGAQVQSARQAGADYVLLGGIHKQSTLIQWAKIMVVNTHDGAVAFDRLLTFRGDDDAAWRHAAAFTVHDILQHLGRP